MANQDAIVRIPPPINEPIKDYPPGDPARDSLKKLLQSMPSEKIEIPCIIGGKEIRTGNIKKVVMPHEHQHVLAECHQAGANEIRQAMEASRKAKKDWEHMHWQDRAGVFLKAARLLAGPWRDTLNAATMLGQSKNPFQAEIDAACEMIDFLRFNAHFYERILEEQPISPYGIWNRMDYRPLEGFVVAVTPFNFTSIAGNLPSVPALVGNTVIWKPSTTQLYSAYYLMRLFEAAGLPPGVINFVPTSGSLVGEILLRDRDLAGLHFTGSTGVFQSIWKTVGENISTYRTYPRLVGETGGKDFIFAHPTADLEALNTALIRGAFEYQGQKCSAASRAYVPSSLWPKLKTRLVEEISTIQTGDVRDFRNFMNAVIDEASFDNISSYIEHAKKSSDAEILIGGNANKKTGYFIPPTVIVTKNPKYKSMSEEIFGPVLTIHVYEDSKLDETVKLCDETSPYALTGAIFAEDPYALSDLSLKLRHAAGNIYYNDKPTGAIVGQQPFGGARASGTNDKAGSPINLQRWLSPRTIKEMFYPAKDYRYPFMGQE